MGHNSRQGFILGQELLLDFAAWIDLTSNADNSVAADISCVAGLSIRAGSRPKQPATGQTLAGYFRLTLLLILIRNLK